MVINDKVFKFSSAVAREIAALGQLKRIGSRGRQRLGAEGPRTVPSNPILGHQHRRRRPSNDTGTDRGASRNGRKASSPTVPALEGRVVPSGSRVVGLRLYTAPARGSSIHRATCPSIRAGTQHIP